MAVLTTLLVVTLLSVLVLGMNSRSLLALTRAKHSAHALDAVYVMRSGVSTAMAFLERDAAQSSIDTLSEMWAQEITDFPVGDGTVSVHIDDEASKFNLNTLVTPQGRPNDRAIERFGRLLTLVGDDERLSMTVAAWLRTNRESLSYVFLDVSEILLVSGMTPEAFDRVQKHLTVSTDPMNARNINVNTVTPEVLAALSPALSPALVESILERRRDRPFTEIADLKRAQGMNDEILYTISDVIDVKTSTFTVRVTAKVADVVRRGTALVSRDRAAVKIVAWKDE
jgi:general secretion pathway protein K